MKELEGLYKERDMRGLYKHLMGSVGLDGRPSGVKKFIKDETRVLLKSQSDIANRGRRFFSVLLDTKSSQLQPDIIEEVRQKPATQSTDGQVPLGSATIFSETGRAEWGMQNWKAPREDSLPVELMKVD